MKILKTELTEQQLRERLAQLCQPMERRGRGLAGREAYVFAEKRGKFWLGVHHASGNTSPGLAADRLDVRLHTEEDGRVTVSYRFGRHPALLIPYLLFLAMGLTLAVWSAIDWMKGAFNAGRNPMFALFLLGFGIVGLCGKPAERRALEGHLRYLCGLDTPAEEAAEAIPDGADEGAEPILPDVEEVYPLCMVFEGREYLTLYTYPGDGQLPALLGGGGRLWRFRDPAQMRRFCESRGVEIVGEPEILKFDSPVTPNTSPAHVLSRWNRLALMAEALGIPFAGEEEAHGKLYECLLERSLPMADGGNTPLEDEQVEEVRQVFAAQDELFAGFTLWRE